MMRATWPACHAEFPRGVWTTRASRALAMPDRLVTPEHSMSRTMAMRFCVGADDLWGNLWGRAIGLSKKSLQIRNIPPIGPKLDTRSRWAAVRGPSTCAGNGCRGPSPKTSGLLFVATALQHSFKANSLSEPMHCFQII
jgi:hypothetical protein